jgi:hypothetical protein
VERNSVVIATINNILTKTYTDNVGQGTYSYRVRAYPINCSSTSPSSKTISVTVTQQITDPVISTTASALNLTYEDLQIVADAFYGDGQLTINGIKYNLNKTFVDDQVVSLGLVTTENITIYIDYSNLQPQGYAAKILKTRRDYSFDQVTPDGSYYRIIGNVMAFCMSGCTHYIGCYLGSSDQIFYYDAAGAWMSPKQAFCQSANSTNIWCAVDIALMGHAAPLIRGSRRSTAIVAKTADESHLTKISRVIKKAWFMLKIQYSVKTFNIKNAAKMDPELLKIFNVPRTVKISSPEAEAVVDDIVKQGLGPTDFKYWEKYGYLIVLTDEAAQFKPFKTLEGVSENILVWGKRATATTPLEDQIIGKDGVKWIKSSMTISQTMPTSEYKTFMEIDNMLVRNNPNAVGGKTVIVNFYDMGTSGHNFEQADRFMRIKANFGNYEYKTVSWENVQNAEVVITGRQKLAVVDSIPSVECIDVSTVPVQTPPIPFISKSKTQTVIYNLKGCKISVNKVKGCYITQNQNQSGRIIKRIYINGRNPDTRY